MQIDPEQPQILVFDVNETLLDISALRPQVEKVFGNGRPLKEWFSNTLLYSQAATLVGAYADFTTLARHALEMTAKAHAVQLREQDADSVVDGMKTLPAYPDVSDALERLHNVGFRLVAFTNSTQSAVEGQLRTNNLTQMFERIFSVDAVKKYKPHPDVYRNVADQLNVATSRMMMIAAHPWDLMGAQAAGCKIAFVERAGTAWFPLIAKPKISGPTLEEIATQLISEKAET